MDECSSSSIYQTLRQSRICISSYGTSLSKISAECPSSQSTDGIVCKSNNFRPRNPTSLKPSCHISSNQNLAHDKIIPKSFSSCIIKDHKNRSPKLGAAFNPHFRSQSHGTGIVSSLRCPGISHSQDVSIHPKASVLPRTLSSTTNFNFDSLDSPIFSVAIRSLQNDANIPQPRISIVNHLQNPPISSRHRRHTAQENKKVAYSGKITSLSSELLNSQSNDNPLSISDKGLNSKPLNKSEIIEGSIPIYIMPNFRDYSTLRNPEESVAYPGLSKVEIMEAKDCAAKAPVIQIAECLISELIKAKVNADLSVKFMLNMHYSAIPGNKLNSLCNIARYNGVEYQDDKILTSNIKTKRGRSKSWPNVRPLRNFNVNIRIQL